MNLLNKQKSHEKMVDEMDRSNSNDVIRTGSIKSTNGIHKTPLEMEAPASQPNQLSTLRKHSWANSLGLGLLALLSAVALGVAIWGAAEGVSNSNSINDLKEQVGSMPSSSSSSGSSSSASPSSSRGVEVSDGGGAASDNSSAAFDGGWPEVLLRRDPNPVQGYSYQSSLYRGTGYWAPRPSISLDRPAAYLSVAVNGNMAYLTGGRHMKNDGDIVTSDELLRFDAVLGLYGDAAPMPEPRSTHASAYLDDKVYVIGGYSNGEDLVEGSPADQMMVYDVAADAWETAPGPIKARGRTCAAALNGKLYVVGGFKDGQQPTSSIEEYDPETKKWKQVGELPFARGGSGCVSVGDLIYIAGGTKFFTASTRTGATAEFLSFDPSTGEVKKLQGLSSPRSGLSLVSANDADGSILALGGMMLAANGAKVYQVGNGLVEAYLPQHDVWVGKAPMVSPRFGAAAMAGSQGAYVFGGNAVCEQGSKKCNALDTVEVFEFSDVPDVFVHTLDSGARLDGDVPTSDVLLTGQHSGTVLGSEGDQYQVVGSLYMGAGYWAKRDDMPMGHLSDFQLVSISNDNGERAGAYLIGGANWDQLSNATWLFDAYLDRWTRMADMPEPRMRHAAAVVGNKVFVLGGFSNWSNHVDGIPARSMLVYNINTASWTTVEDGGPQTPRTDACAAAVGGKVYYAGGYSAGFAATLHSVEVYDPDTASWSTVSPMPTPRGDVMCATLQGRLVVLGGYYDPTNEWNPNSFRHEVEAYDPTTAEWSSLAKMPNARGDMAVVELPNERLMVLGGETTTEDASRTMVASNGVAEYVASQDVWVPKAPMVENRFRFDAAYVANYVYVFGGQRTAPSTDPDKAPPGLASSEAYHYTQAPDVFVWMKVPTDGQ